MTYTETDQSYPDHPDRFDWWPQLLCTDGLTGRSYWEVEWDGQVFVSVSYKKIGRKNEDRQIEFGKNDHSWRLNCYGNHYSVYHNNTEFSRVQHSASSNRVAVYLDWPAGTLSFYSVSSGVLTHLHTFSSTFTDPLYPGFGAWFWPGSSVSLCSLEEGERTTDTS